MGARCLRTLIAIMVLFTGLLSAAGPGAMAQEEWTGVPPAVDCSGEPIKALQIIDALETGNELAADPNAIPLIGIDESDLPVGIPASAAEVAAASEVLWSMTACGNGGDFARFFGHLTPAAIHSLIAGLFEGLGRPPGPFTEEELSLLTQNLEVGLTVDPQELIGDEQGRIDAIRDVRVLEDGRILLLVDGRLVLDGTGYVILTGVDGVWKVDRLGQIGDVDLLGISSGELIPPSTTGETEVMPVITPDADEGTGGTGDSTSRDGPGVSIALDAIRTLVYHEITSWTASPTVRGEESPILSDDGGTVAFSRSPASDDPEHPNRVFVLDSRGGQEREIDSYTPRCYCSTLIDISADGSRVVGSDSVQLRAADSNGSEARLLFTLASNELSAVRLSGDGNTIVFRIYRDTAFLDSTEAIERGFYAINWDGSNLRQLAGAEEIAAAFGVTPDLIPTGGPISDLDVSHDGNVVVGAVHVEPEAGGMNQGLISMIGEGSVQVLLEPVAFITNVALSADGTTAGVVFTYHETGLVEAGVVSVSGGVYSSLTDTSTEPPGVGQPLTGSFDRISISRDGSLLLLGGTGFLFDTRTGVMTSLAVGDGSHAAGDPPPLVGARVEAATMDASGQRFLYVIADIAGVLQLATIDLNPVETGEAPAVTDVTIDRESIGLNQVTSATVTAKVSTDLDVLRVGATVLLDGRSDMNVTRWGTWMSDDGTLIGDVVAGDGTFTTNAITADCCAPSGARTFRVKAETIGSDGRRHATVVEGGTFMVTD